MDIPETFNPEQEAKDAIIASPEITQGMNDAVDEHIREKETEAPQVSDPKNEKAAEYVSAVASEALSGMDADDSLADLLGKGIAGIAEEVLSFGRGGSSRAMRFGAYALSMAIAGAALHFRARNKMNGGQS